MTLNVITPLVWVNDAGGGVVKVNWLAGPATRANDELVALVSPVTDAVRV